MGRETIYSTVGAQCRQGREQRVIRDDTGVEVKSQTMEGFCALL